jgi:hypothetical protein
LDRVPDLKVRPRRQREKTVRLLPYLHPLWQIGAIVVALWTLSLGLRLRALRRRRLAGPGKAAEAPSRAALVERHARAGLTFLAAIAVGYTGGPLILGLARDKPVFESAHAFFATLTLLVLAGGGSLGWRLLRGRGSPRDRDLHVYCMGLGLLLVLVAAMLGLGLLP